jgi:hypothetical protein
MKRLVWISIGAATTVMVIRKGAALSERYLPAGTRDALGTVGRVASAVRTLKSQFLAGMSEREEELRHDLIGDVDIDALRSERKRADRPTHDPADDDDLPYSFF